MEKIDIVKILKGCREFNPNEILKHFRSQGSKFWSWGANGFTNMEDKALVFRVNGHHHKGRVYIVLNGLDLFDVYLTSTQQNMKRILNDVYLEDLFETLDVAIEKIPEYTH